MVATTARVELVRHSAAPAIPRSAPGSGEALRTVRAWMTGRFVEDVPVIAREDVGEALEGPAIVLEDTGALVLEPGWSLSREADGTLRLVDREGPQRATATTVCDPVELEIFANAFMSIAEQMGAVLQRTAVSTNIRERLDFSCALFDGSGSLVANAPHIPVHLGAMGETVRAVVAAHPEPAEGDVFVSNDPAAGGSHLPDVTVVSPVHMDGELRFFVASRGHQADVGGITPGSMPPFSKTLEEEGVVFRSYRDGRRFLLTPESSVETQQALGADVILPLDELLPLRTPRAVSFIAATFSMLALGRSRTALSQLDDRALADIGLTRGDVEKLVKA